MLITDLVNFYVKKLNAAGINNALEEIRLIIEEALNMVKIALTISMIAISTPFMVKTIIKLIAKTMQKT